MEIDDLIFHAFAKLKAIERTCLREAAVVRIPVERGDVDTTGTESRELVAIGNTPGGGVQLEVCYARAKVDRIACPRLIKRFIDPNAEFLFVEPDRVMEVAALEAAIPFDVPDVELGHHGTQCSFDAIIKKYNMTDPALLRLAEIVRGADTSARNLTSESAGLYALATGFHALNPSRFPDDHALLNVEFPVYDAFYEYCRMQAAS